MNSHAVHGIGGTVNGPAVKAFLGRVLFREKHLESFVGALVRRRGWQIESSSNEMWGRYPLRLAGRPAYSTTMPIP